MAITISFGNNTDNNKQINTNNKRETPSTAPKYKPTGKEGNRLTNEGTPKGQTGGSTGGSDTDFTGNIDKKEDRKQNFSAFGATGVDTTSMLADIQNKYGVVAASSGRRGAQARAVLAEQGNTAAREFLSSELYQQLLDDPRSINNRAVQGKLQSALGDQWKALTSGRKGDQGTVIYENLEDPEKLTELLKISGNPFSLAREILQIETQGSATQTTTGEAGSTAEQAGESALPDPGPVPNAPGSPATGQAPIFDIEKRV